MNVAGIIVALLIVNLALVIIFKDKIILPILFIVIGLGLVMYFVMVYDFIMFVINVYQRGSGVGLILGIIALVILAIPYIHVIKTILDLD